MAIPMWQTSVDKALASGKSVEAMRAALSNNPVWKVAQKKALDYLNRLHPVLPDATTWPYTKANADAAAKQTNIVPNSTDPSKSSDYSLWDVSNTNSWADRLKDTMGQYEENSKKTAAEIEANARKFWQEQSNVIAQRDSDKLARASQQEADLEKIKSTREANIDQRRKDADALLAKQDEIAAMNSNIAMADAGKSGLQLSAWDITTVQNDIMSKYATNIANAMDFKNKTNMSLDEALTNTGLAIFGKQTEIDNFKNLLQDNKYAPILEAIKEASAWNKKAIDDVNTFYQEMTKKKADEEYTRVAIDERISAEEKSFSEASSQKKEAILQNEIKDIPGAPYVWTEISTVLNLYPNASRTFIVWELARRAMLNESARTALLQAVAAWAKLPAEFQAAVTGQTTKAVKESDTTVAQKTTQQNQAQANNPAQVNNSTYVLSEANQTFIKNALNNATPERLKNVKIVLDKKLATNAVTQAQYDAIRKAIWI